MTTLIWIAAGGAIGAMLRYLVSIGLHAWLGRVFPYGTLTVNVLGSFLIGFLAIFMVERMAESAHLRSLILVGLLGAFTTFSTFSLETLTLFEEGRVMLASVNVIASVILCLMAVWVGTILGRML